MAVIVAITSVHHLGVLCAALLATMLFAGRSAPRIARRAALAIVLFNSIVTISYVVLSLIRGDFAARFVVLLNLRVFLLTSITFLFIDRVNPFKALSFSKTLTYLMSLAYSQVLTFRRLYEDFRMALKSRTRRRIRVSDLYRHGAASASFFIEKSLNDATEISEAMTSRGFSND
jgi:cobalt/nickel transport system permease protein